MYGGGGEMEELGGRKGGSEGGREGIGERDA